MQHGAIINPYKMWQGQFIPHWLAVRPELTWNAKAVYSRLSFDAHKGTGVLTDPGHQVVADTLGMSERTVRRGYADLLAQGLLQRERRGKMLTNRYFFLYHRWMDVELEVTGQNGQSLPAAGQFGQQNDKLANIRTNWPATSRKSAKNKALYNDNEKGAQGARGNEPARPGRQPTAANVQGDFITPEEQKAYFAKMMQALEPKPN